MVKRVDHPERPPAGDEPMAGAVREASGVRYAVLGTLMVLAWLILCLALRKVF